MLKLNVKQTIGIMLLFMASCTQVKSPDTVKILKDKQQRTEIMKMISNDHQMMMDMMDHMMESEHAMQMIMENQGMMNHLMDNEHMMGNIMQMMATDSITCLNMQQMMMGNEHMMKVMMDMYNKGKMIRNDMMMKGHMHSDQKNN